MLKLLTILSGTVASLWSCSSMAHVKWFAAYDLEIPPRSFYTIVSDEVFLVFCLALVPMIFVVICIDGYLYNNRVLQGWWSITQFKLRSKHISTSLRVGVSLFFFSAVAYGLGTGNRFILTPELQTQNLAVLFLQIAIASIVLFPKLSYLAGIGIVALYLYALSTFGLYHMLDYPIFIGVAVCIAIQSRLGDEYSVIGQGIMRLCTGVTLLWASIEKFAYPEWSFALLNERPAVSFGFSSEFFMVAAGFVEFCAAYLLITGKLSARIAALILLLFFVSAIYFFGLIDAIGHAVIIVVLVLLALNDNPLTDYFDARGLFITAGIHALLFAGTLAIFTALYTQGHNFLS